MAKVDFLNQAESFVRKLHFSTSWSCAQENQKE